MKVSGDGPCKSWGKKCFPSNDLNCWAPDLLGHALNNNKKHFPTMDTCFVSNVAEYVELKYKCVF